MVFFVLEKLANWRRSYNVPFHALELTDERHPKFDRCHTDLTPEQLPTAESIKIILERILPYWHSVLEPTIKSGKRILISAHGNSIRSLIKYLDNISDTEITELNIPSGVPLVYELDENLKVIKHYYLGYSEEITLAAAAAANQGNTKTY